MKIYIMDPNPCFFYKEQIPSLKKVAIHKAFHDVELISTLSSSPAYPMTLQPLSLAICPTRLPTAPAAPDTTTVSPALCSETFRELYYLRRCKYCSSQLYKLSENKNQILPKGRLRLPLLLGGHTSMPQ